MALSAILDKVRKEGVPDKSSPKDIRAASGFSLDSLWQTFDAYTPQGKTLNLSHINVLSLLAGISLLGAAFTISVNSCMANFPAPRKHLGGV